MKHTREEVANLDKSTLNFCVEWLQDIAKRARLSDGIHIESKQKQALKEAHTSGIFEAIAHLENLSKKQENPQSIAQEFVLL